MGMLMQKAPDRRQLSFDWDAAVVTAKTGRADSIAGRGRLRPSAGQKKARR